MAQWDITVPAGTGVGAGSSNNNSDITGVVPGDFDGATINSVTLVSPPNVTLNANSSNDTMTLRWCIRTSGGTEVYGTVGSDAGSIAYCNINPFNLLPTAISAGGAPSPAPTTAVAADWDQLYWAWVYSVAGKNDASTCDWASYTIRVDYTAAGGDTTIPGTELLPDELDLAGKIPTLEYDYLVKPAKRGVVLAGKIPVAFREDTVAPAQGLLRLGIRGLYLRGSTPTVVVSAVGGDITIPGTELLPDDLVIAGKIPTVEHSYFPDVAERDLVIAGKIPTVERSYLLDVVERDLVIAGKVPVVNQTLSAEPAKRGVVLAGKIPEVRQTWSAEPAKRGVVLAGKIPLAGVTQIALPDKRGVVLAGKIPTLERSYFLDVTERDLVIAGKIPVVNQTLSAEPAKRGVVLAGKIPLAGVTQLALPDKRGVVLAGKAPTVSVFASPPVRALTLAGKIPTLERDYFINVAERDLVIAGKIPAALATLLATPDKRGVVLAGKIPEVRQTWSAEPAKRGVILAGKIPAALATLLATPDKRGVVLAGKIPVVNQTQSAEPAKRGVVLAGKIPLAQTTLLAEPGVRALTLTGKIPVPDVTSGGTTIEVPYGSLRAFSVRGLQLRGATPTVLVAAVDPVRTPDEDALVLSGQAPSLDLAFSPATLQLDLIPEDGLWLRGWPPTLIRETEFHQLPDEGTLVLSGKVPELDNTDRAEAPETLVGALTLGSVKPRLRNTTWDHLIPVDEATLAFTGAVPTRSRGLLLRGYAPNLVGDNPEPQAATLNLTGLQPDIEDTTEQPLRAYPLRRQRYLTGYVPALEISQTTEDASLQLEGWAAATWASSPVFFPDEATLTFTPYAPEVPEAPIRRPDEATLVLTGKVLTLRYGGPATPSAGSAALLGYIPMVLSTPTAQPDTSALALTGEPVYIGRSIWVAAVQRNLNGKVPEIDNTDIFRTAEPGEATLSLAGQAFIDVETAPLPVSAGALTLAGKVPDLDQETESVRIPRPDDLALTGQVPDRLIDGRERLPVAALTLSGQVPAVLTKRSSQSGARTRLISLTTRYALGHRLWQQRN